MQFRVLTAVELFDANPVQHVEFDNQMQNEGWSKIDTDANAYCAAFEAECDADVNRVAEADIERAARAAGVALWDGICVMSDVETEDQPQDALVDQFAFNPAC
ncbi:MAG: hypothetical protein O3A00_07610 [Planctomycetota bacterium]|nr:hypothetical protein [Planctomycetota bacterium]